MLPTFITIGAMRCGSTSFHSYLNKHPQIGMSSLKELDYFVSEKNLDRGLNWYIRQFPKSATVRGETSPNYTKRHLFTGVPARIHKLLPDLRLFYLVRNPIDRALSHYVHNLAGGMETRPIEEAFGDFRDNNYLETGLYMWQLEAFLEFYPSESIFIVRTEELNERPEAIMTKVFTKLGLDNAGIDAAVFNDRLHEGRDKMYDRRFVRSLRRIPGLTSATKKLVPYKWLRPFGKGTRIVYPQMSLDLRRRLSDYYSDDWQAFQKFVGRPPTILE